MGGKNKPIWTAEEFWPRVDQSAGPTACWPWTRMIGNGGYGAVLWQKGWTHAHRVALMLTVGPAPEGKPWALHHCDNRPCCNPTHLMWGTPKENTAQMWERNRGFRHGNLGEKNVKAKLTEPQIIEIRSLYPAWTLKQLGVRFAVSFSTIQRIVTRKYWKHL